ncbi:hypothetical protein A2U01_0043242, partial [Trifolium medium]|nr:hypothetical protein [Trifolium medium]
LGEGFPHEYLVEGNHCKSHPEQISSLVVDSDESDSDSSDEELHNYGGPNLQDRK